jgi:hypothetical protein
MTCSGGPAAQTCLGLALKEARRRQVSASIPLRYPYLNLAGCLQLSCRDTHSPKSPPACLPCSTEDSHLVSVSLSWSLQDTVQVWDVSESVDSPQAVYSNPAPHPFTSISVCPAFPVIAAGDSSGTVALLRLRRPKESRDA